MPRRIAGAGPLMPIDDVIAPKMWLRCEARRGGGPAMAAVVTTHLSFAVRSNAFGMVGLWPRPDNASRTRSWRFGYVASSPKHLLTVRGA